MTAISSNTTENPYSGLGVNTISGAPTLGKGGDTELGQEEFLKLITTQMNNQDPMKPTENGEFISQMAQFSSMSAIQSMDRTFKELAETLMAGQAMQASSLVGRNVLVDSDEGVLPEGGALVGAVDLPNRAYDVKVEILSPSGQQLNSFSLGEQPAGRTFFQWDGTGPNGQVMPPGVYRMQVQYNTGSGNEALEPMANTLVDSVTLDSQRGAQLNTVGLGQYAMSSVKEIR